MSDLAGAPNIRWRDPEWSATRLLERRCCCSSRAVCVFCLLRLTRGDMRRPDPGAVRLIEISAGCRDYSALCGQLNRRSRITLFEFFFEYRVFVTRVLKARATRDLFNPCGERTFVSRQLNATRSIKWALSWGKSLRRLGF